LYGKAVTVRSSTVGTDCGRAPRFGARARRTRTRTAYRASGDGAFCGKAVTVRSSAVGPDCGRARIFEEDEDGVPGKR